MNRYITLAGKRYLVSERKHTDGIDQIQDTTKGLTGKTIIQNFGFQTETLDVTVLVYLVAPRPEFGTVEDLKTAYTAGGPVTVFDVDGTQRSMVFTGRLDLPRAYSLVDSSAPFKVRLQLEEVVS